MGIPEKFRPKAGKKLFKPGQSGNPLGKPRGTLNKTTTLLKDAILEAASLAGGSNDREGLINYLKQAAIEAPGPFLSLLGKVLPLQIAASRNDAASPMQFESKKELGQRLAFALRLGASASDWKEASPPERQDVDLSFSGE